MQRKVRKLMTKHFSRIASIAAARVPLHHDAPSVGKSDRCAPLWRFRTNPLAKTSMIRRNLYENTLMRTRQSRKRVGARSFVE